MPAGELAHSLQKLMIVHPLLDVVEKELTAEDWVPAKILHHPIQSADITILEEGRGNKIRRGRHDSHQILNLIYIISNL